MLNIVEWKTLEDTVWNHPLEICPLSDKILPVVEYEDLTNQVQKYIYIILKLIICMVLIELQVNLSCSLTTFTVCLTEIVTWSDIQYIRSKNKNYPIYSPELSELISTYFSVSLQSQENVKEQWGLLMKLSKVGVNPQTVPIRHPFKIFFSKWLVSLFQKIRFKW